jgi:hypothetical protein
VYVVQGGQRRWIPNPDVLEQHYGGWGAVQLVPDGALAAVPSIPRDGTVLREFAAAPVYVVQGGQRRWIPNPDVLELYGGWGAVREVPDGSLAAIPEGPGVGEAELAQQGRCTVQEQTLDVAGVHAALLRSGRVLFFSYDEPQEDNVNRGKWQLWSPETGPVTPESQVMGRNAFCSGHCFLPDGRLLVVGGQSNNIPPFVGWGSDHDVHLFDPMTESWSRLADMPAARYYPTCVTLPNGNAVIAGGAANRYVPTFTNIPNDEYEMFDWQRDTRSQPLRFNPGHITELYPFMHVLPDGSPGGALFVYSRNEARLFYPQHGTWNPTSFRTISPFSRTYPHQGSCVLLPLMPDQGYRARLLLVGGQGEEGGAHQATDTAEIFEFNAQTHHESYWRSPHGGNMHSRRFMGDAVLLANATVLVVNGAGSGEADHSHDPVMHAELFDPETETWRVVAPVNHPRLYHSAAILLPDGRVLISGNTRHWNPDNEIEDTTLEIFSPPYLFRGPRPVIQAAPSEISYGQAFDVAVSDPQHIASVALVRQSSTTHTNNMDQCYVGLVIEQRHADRLTVRAPGDGTIAPPGFFILFVLSEQQVPSVGHVLGLRQLARPDTALVVDTWVTVREADYDVDTGIDLSAGDEVEFEANGQIWSGVAFTGTNGPKGWNNIDHDPKFPLHEGPDAHPFCLLARFAGASYFFVGDSRARERYPYGETRRLYLRINDDKPNNGSGEFNCHVLVWR